MQSLTITDQKDRRSQGNKHRNSVFQTSNVLLMLPIDQMQLEDITLIDAVQKEQPLRAQSREEKGGREI